VPCDATKALNNKDLSTAKSVKVKFDVKCTERHIQKQFECMH